MVLADDHFDVDAEVVLAAEDFEDASAGGARGGGPIDDFDIDDQAFEVPCAFVFWSNFCRAAKDAMRWRRRGDLGGSLRRGESESAASCGRQRE